jgi:hypothetical protein
MLGKGRLGKTIKGRLGKVKEDLELSYIRKAMKA